MFELFNKRKLIKEILKQFSSDQWEDLVPLIMEIGILYLKQKHPSMLYLTVDDYRMILMDMKSKVVDQNVKIRKEGQKTNNISNTILKDNENNTGNNFRKDHEYNSIRRKRLINSTYENYKIARKPSGEWRKGDKTVYKNGNSSNFRNRTDSNDSKISPEKYRTEKLSSRSPLCINPDIYPKWWGDLTSEDDYSRSRTKSKEDYRLSRAEVYIVENKTILNRNGSKSCEKKSTKKYLIKTDKIQKNFANFPKRDFSKEKTNKAINSEYLNNKTNLASNKNQNNLNMVESKIKSMVEYDKLIHNQIKREAQNETRTRNDFHTFADKRDENAEWHYKESNIRASFRDKSDDERNLQRSIRTNADSSKKRINYLISYDKNLKPEMIREKSHEKPLNRNNSNNNSNRKITEAKKLSMTSSFNNDKENKTEEISHEPQTAKFIEEEPKLRNEQNEFVKSKNSNSIEDNNNEYNKSNRDGSFKKSNSNKLENDREILSSYAPSERTLNIFQRDYSKKYTDYLNSKSKNSERNGNLNRHNDSLLTNNSIYQ